MNGKPAVAGTGVAKPEALRPRGPAGFMAAGFLRLFPGRGGLVMGLAKDGICDFGWKARDFALKGTDGKTYTLADVRGPKGTLVVFICNHCPYVKASIGRIVVEAAALREIGIGTIAVMPNDT